jgi:hypothetical protein
MLNPSGRVAWRCVSIHFRIGSPHSIGVFAVSRTRLPVEGLPETSRRFRQPCDPLDRAQFVQLLIQVNGARRSDD